MAICFQPARLVCKVACSLALFCLTTLTASANTIVFTVCHEYGCNEETEVYFPLASWQEITSLLLEKPESPRSEREHIARVIAGIEKQVGPLTGTQDDRAGNYADTPNGQMDCIDESTNTTTYLTLLEQNGLLRWHKVSERVRRMPWFIFQHWTAVITELKTGKAFAVDSWYLPNGKQPYIQALDSWYKKNPLPYNPDAASHQSSRPILQQLLNEAPSL
ncbi:MAG: hypothetical protein MJA28_15010 [Gammaproteobacteria bacterium]|nr:hypothetical protein [Gammaproteobacteria bacterium]